MAYSKTLTLLWTIITTCTITIIHSQNQTNKTNKPAVIDSYILACGATAGPSIDADGRKWWPDLKFIKTTTTSATISATARSLDPSVPSPVPYMHARFYIYQTTYEFPVSPSSRQWLRLHFYPSSYTDGRANILDPSKSFFSVFANNLTLLDNFSVSITAVARTQAHIVREFALVGPESGRVDLTFAPSKLYGSSFAFVNGIEITPTPEIFRWAPLVGSPDQGAEAQLFAMQTMFRLNVGGPYVPAGDGPGSTWMWFDDWPYLYGASDGMTNEADGGVTIAYPSLESRNAAPPEVYRTARTMGHNLTIHVHYNLTWIFEVDVSFVYLVRLHFCDYHFERVNQRAFDIFIDGRLAEFGADVMVWSRGRGVPVYKDYVTYARGRNYDGMMRIDLHPNDMVEPEFYDVILNGLEIFKLNDANGNLAGPNPEPSRLEDEPKPEPEPRKSTHRSKPSKDGGIVCSMLGMLAGISLIACILTAFIGRKRRIDKNGSEGKNDSSKSSGCSRISNLGGGLCCHFTLAEIRASTEDFSEARLIGVGGFGKVYRASIDGPSPKTVAVKRASPSSQQGVHEFLNEIDLLSKLRHRHLVSLISACDENDEMILVYDYMANGTLRDHLYKTKFPKKPLPWVKRLGACIGAARGIHYLHTGAKHAIIHRDLKSTNILLDERWVAKVSDFGLSRTGHGAEVTTSVKGSFGYLDPEYFRTRLLTEKSDVYSFGVVLFEVLCGRPAIWPGRPREEVSLAEWAVSSYERNSLEGLVDSFVKDEIHGECLKHFMETGVKCLADLGSDRPAMGEVLWNLECCLRLQRRYSQGGQ